jgi:formate dehydrogenase gamma subunit
MSENQPVPAKDESPAPGRTYRRFTLSQRITHIAMLLSFTTLALTGLPQKFPQAGISQAIISLFGGIQTARTIHHGAAFVMLVAAAFHIVHLGYRLYVQRVRPTMLPVLKDIRDAGSAFGYNIGVAKSRPQMGRYTFEEKVEYWAFVWGTVVMAMTGFIMLSPILVTTYVTGQVVPAAKAAHGAEAILAVLAILIWHFYGVHLKLFNKSMFTGKMTEQQMLHEHPLELADIKAGIADRQVSAEAVRKRKRIYTPVASVVLILLVVGIYYFLNAETTAIVTQLPGERPGPAFVPQTPTPFPTPAPTAPLPAGADLTWDGAVSALLQQKCAACHGSAQVAGLSMLTYADIMAGGADGPVVLPGDSANSPIIQIQTAGGHAVELSPEELQLIADWIDAGAAEK